MMKYQKFFNPPYSDLTCYEFVTAVQKEIFNIKMDDIQMEELDMSVPERSNWELIENPKEGDIVLMGISGEPTHLGIYLDGNMILHSYGRNASIHNISIIKRIREIIGYYRHVSKI